TPATPATKRWASRSTCRCSKPLERRPRRARTPALAAFTALLGAVALLTPLWAPEPDRASGLLLLLGVGAELLYSFRCRTSHAQRSAWASAGYTLLLALVLLNTSWLAVGAVAIFLAAPFVLDALRHAGTAIRQVAKLQPFLREAGSAFGNLAVVAGIALLGR